MFNEFNPFNPNSIVTPTLFAGRHEQVLQILKKLAQVREGLPSSFVLQGERGIGKTALAKLILHVAEAKDPKLEKLNFLASYYSVERGQTFESVLQACLNSMTDRMPDTVLKRLTNRLGGFFKNGKFTIGAFGASATYEGLGSSTPEEALLAMKDRAVSIFSNIISGLDEVQDTKNKRDGVLLVIDEIHNLKDLSGTAQVLRAIATTLDVNQLGKISFMIIGYAEGMNHFFEGDPSARRHFDLINLAVMPRHEAKEVLIKGFTRTGLTYDENVLEKNIDVAGGYPHSIQIIGHNLVGVDENQHIDQDDWAKALRRSAIELTQKDFSEFYDFKGRGTLRETVLNLLALRGRPMTKQEIKKLSDGKNIYTETCLGALKKSGAIKETPDRTIVLHSMLFRAAILIHLYTHAQENQSYSDLIKKIKSLNNKTDSI
ncbi:MAG: hypothetical protein A2W61_06475 [Deltaproteobacteria bacterium RIFCSPLOWO2_01_44_7]|nr:MAG: hypothetical protein A2712_05460 [Deltaproteobacteria bacterium RIFCSPHIGHO2_01_FULL_43_49]OGQ14350.1 MAG: hypothetical protein A3D22_04925 [Deltaproteobacteria bacterium RIFCSPHIGHO2_02_FULL_44_53]OGQ27610.1 MAG: hypothetical protein A3D98_09250 [Deltaproteobacteria bacterium RIFCSPHIGHO2_12_FULL_44_21]OGQ30791.1 MAG: hypothetical protein A2979_01335 [Deltaproteobacteria bacterium RIFCSPLOWO2_01_FULL_45_74]OGQ41469.1 MAG: hypothetical protein A2W61_06475 [Deltaproteobacteria bacterium 